jgi:hypothetical protein
LIDHVTAFFRGQQTIALIMAGPLDSVPRQPLCAREKPAILHDMA